MAKPQKNYVCQSCGAVHHRWEGKCDACGEWNTIVEEVVAAAPPKSLGKGKGAHLMMRPLAETVAAPQRLSTGIEELNRVLGGGLVEGSAILIGGDPGIGKSTLLLQMAALMASKGSSGMYISGEESVEQIQLRAMRLGVQQSPLGLASATSVRDILTTLESAKAPDILVIDSVQTLYLDTIESAPGTVAQVRASAYELIRYAKKHGTALFLVGHVTKDGQIAGPRVLEHMVDTVLYFEGDRMQEYRLLRAVKNRFGSVNELGVFQMTEKGMRVVQNPSEQLLSHRAKGASGSVVFCGLEGSRPLLCDVQALAAQSYLGTPRRTVSGADAGRVALLLAVLEKRAGQKTYNQDVYVNVAGGLELSEPAADLALCVAVASSLRDRSVGQTVAVMGEVGLAGEVRAIPQCERRIAECQRLGFDTIVIPRENLRRLKAPEGLELLGVDTVMQALSVLF